MRICLIAEGCYPYVAGGVSAWVQMLINGMPQHEFVIFAIGAEKKMQGQYKYTLPPNVVQVHEVFLDEALTQVNKKREKRTLTAAQKDVILSLLRGTLRDWHELFELFGKKDSYSANDFLMSDQFLDIITELSEEDYAYIPFRDTFWTIRSILIPVLNLMRCEMPEADIYHSVSTGYAGMLGAKFHYFSGKPYIVTEHGIYSREREEEILKSNWVNPLFKTTWISFFRSLCLSAYQEADELISLFYGARRIQIDLGADEKKCSVIPNGIKMSRFEKIPCISQTPHPLTIGAIIRVVPIKDIKTMLYSFAQVKQARPDALLYLIGPYDEDPDYYQECKELIEGIRLKDVVFVGRVRVEEWMERLDVILLTSVSEGQPFVLLEAMAAHRPVVSTNVGSCSEIIEGAPDEFGPAGAVAPVMNPARIARAILDTGVSAEHMRMLAQNGFARVDKYYREEDFLASYEELYGKVVRKWQASALN